MKNYFVLLLFVFSVFNIKAQLINTYKVHNTSVSDVIYSPSGDKIASCSEDKSIKISDTKTGIVFKTLTGHTAKVNSICYNTNGSQLVSASDDRSLIIWNTVSGEKVRTFFGHTYYVKSACFSTDDKFIASTGADKTVKLWNAAIGNNTSTFTGNTDYLNCVRFSKDNKYLVYGGDNKIITVINSSTGSLVYSLTGHSQRINSIEISNDNKYIASASSDNTIKIWDLQTGDLVFTLNGHTNIVTDVAFSPDNKYLASSSWDEKIILWDLQNGTIYREVIGTSDFINCVAFSPDGKNIASGSDNNSIQIWDVSDLNISETKPNIIVLNIDNNNSTTNKPISETEDVDINIPEIGVVNYNRFALIIGNENYKVNGGLQADVPYAINDAKTFKQYAIKTLGIPETNIKYLEDATRTEIKKQIDLFIALMDINPSKREFFIFYAGHGYPDENKDAYIMPVDISADYIEDAIKLSDLYQRLIEKSPKRVTVFLDACFSGGGRTGDDLVATRTGIRRGSKDYELKGNLVVFAASSEDQVSKSYIDKQHGMFSYFLFKTLQKYGGKITYGELADELLEKVSTYSNNINNSIQTPRVNVSINIIDLWEKWNLNE